MRHRRYTNVLSTLIDRETAQQSPEEFIRQNQITPSFVNRLGCFYKLAGHQGCVNCLQWNSSGDILASGSDDKYVILWDPLRGKKKTSYLTEHDGNIFSVKFLPFCGDRVIATGAGDNQVHVSDVERSETTYKFSNHSCRVKRLEIIPDSSDTFLSASEDGTVMLFDIRAPVKSHLSNIIVNLKSAIGLKAEAKCLAINPVLPELLAVGANDPFVRVYDRRMLKPQVIEFPSSSSRDRIHHLYKNVPSTAVTQGCVQYYTPGHLPLSEKSSQSILGFLSSTYVTFSPDGRELLANLGWEHVYLFDTKSPQLKPIYSTCNCDNIASSSPTQSKSGSSSQNLTGDIEKLKNLANLEFQGQNYVRAISIYNLALSQHPHPVLFGNRAAAFMKRKWNGDYYAALRDCYSALKLDPNYVKAHYRLTKCLIELSWHSQAKESLEAFRINHPDQTGTVQFKNLVKSLDNTTSGEKRDTDSSSFISEDSSIDGFEMLEDEEELREKAYDFKQRFCGHANISTDIKEATFYGQAGRYIVAGSDNRRFFCWDKKTSNLERIITGDESIVNCVQSHPSTCLLATSGFDSDVKIWAPSPEMDAKEEGNSESFEDYDRVAIANQKRMIYDSANTFEIYDNEDILQTMCNPS